MCIYKKHGMRKQIIKSISARTILEQVEVCKQSPTLPFVEPSWWVKSAASPCPCHWPLCSTETTLHLQSTLIPTRIMHLQHQPPLNVTLPLHVAGLVHIALLVQAPTVMVPMVTVDHTGVRLPTVAVLLHPDVLLRPQLFVHSHSRAFSLYLLSQEGA